MTNVYRPINTANRRTRFDRETWADATVVILSYDTIGTGIFETELLDFKLAYENVPFFSYGVELQPGETLIANDYPQVTAGVSQWHTTEVEEDTQATPFYLGAYLWISIDTRSSYRLRFRMLFEGTALRNVEYLRGLNG